MAEKRKRPGGMVGHKKIKLEEPQELPEVDNTRKEINKAYSRLLAKDVRDRSKHVKKIMGLIGEELVSACQKHDLCRVVQACLKLGNEQQKKEIYQQLRPVFVELASGKYSYFLAKKMLKFGEKEELLAEIMPHIKKMLNSSVGIRFLDLLYKENSYRTRLMHRIFNTDSEVTAEGIEKENILSLKSVVSNAKLFQKSMIEYPLVMHIVWLYVSVCPLEEKLSILSQLYDKIETLLPSRYGTMLAIQALAASDTKQRKLILKAVQGLVPLIADSESYAYLLFIKLIQVIDDSKRVNKAISVHLNQHMNALVNSTNGAKFLLSLLPYSSSFAVLSQNEQDALEDCLNTTSKKDVVLKKKAVFLEVVQRMAEEVRNNFQKVVNDPRLNFLVVAVALGVIHGDYKDLEFVETCAQAVVEWEIMNHGHGHRILKKVIELEAEVGEKTFCRKILKVIKQKKSYIEKLIKSKGVWVLVCLAEKSRLKNKARKILKDFIKPLDTSKAGEKALLELLA